MHHNISLHLAERHHSEWKASGVDSRIIRANVWTVEDSRELDEILNRNTNQRWKHSDHLVPAWVVAGINPET
ncbi:MAG: hypothetical protein NZL92_11660, partial [Gloeomargarita sp. SKYG116]|nr:hypothetical protein [Gloeomargarita sp. SKYG116]MDW8402339.1 hypothetical protein [Gloeomargarita sp. SKYGB_i_bin116]